MNNPEKRRLQKLEYSRRYRREYPEKAQESVRRWCETHREQSREYSRKYRNKHHAAVRESQKRYYQKKKQQMQERGRVYYWATREKARIATRTRRQCIKNNAYEVLGGYVCVGCGETEKSVLTVDHIGGWGAQHRRAGVCGSRVYDAILADVERLSKYRILCMNCQWRARRGISFPCERKLEVVI